MKIVVREFGFEVGKFDTMEEAMQFVRAICLCSREGKREDTDRWYSMNNEYLTFHRVYEDEE